MHAYANKKDTDQNYRVLDITCSVRRAAASWISFIRPLLGLFLLVLPVMAGAQPTACPQFFPSGAPPRLLNPKLEQRTTLLCNDAYASLASGVTHGALWSAEHPTSASLAEAGQTRRESKFHVDDRLPPADQAQLADYRRSGFDRGHM